MTRVYKQQERRNQCPKKHKKPSPKTGPKKEGFGYKEQQNALTQVYAFIPRMKNV